MFFLPSPGKSHSGLRKETRWFWLYINFMKFAKSSSVKFIDRSDIEPLDPSLRIVFTGPAVPAE